MNKKTPLGKTLPTGFWMDERVGQLDALERLVAVYCLTGPQTNRLGLFLLLPGRAAVEVGASKEALLNALERTANVLGWKWDAASRVLWIPTWWRWNEVETVEEMQTCLEDLRFVPQSPFHWEFATQLQALKPDWQKVWQHGFGFRWYRQDQAHTGANSSVTQPHHTSAKNSAPTPSTTNSASTTNCNQTGCWLSQLWQNSMPTHSNHAPLPFHRFATPLWQGQREAG